MSREIRPIDTGQMLRVVAFLIVAAVVAVFAAFAVYFWNFRGGLSPKQEVWGQFGDFVGGTVNPILGSLTLIAVTFTVALQVRQLEIARIELRNSKEELEATREELKRSADAQRLTAEALVEQANHAAVASRLAAMSAALEVTTEAIRKTQVVGALSGHSMPALLEQKQALADEILRITSELLNQREA